MSKKSRYKDYLPIVVLGSASAFFLYDIVSDVIKGEESSFHVLIEGIIFIATSIILAHEILRVVSLQRDLSHQKDKVARLSGELNSVISKDFEDWKLTESEKEVAILLIKGLSMNEIGELRNVKEKTVRTQATSIYTKSKCPNRHELAAKVIEDLLNA